jgi:hypothetical protein
MLMRIRRTAFFFSASLAMIACGQQSGERRDPLPGDASVADAEGPPQVLDGGVPDADASDAAAPDRSVRGRIVGARGTPLARVPVSIGSTVTTTDAEGRFVVADVSPTYDVAFAGPARSATVFAGLRTREPNLVAIVELAATDDATLDLRYPTGAGVVYSALVAAKDWPGRLVANAAVGNVTASLGWGAGETKELDLLSLAYAWDPALGVQRFASAARTTFVARKGQPSTLRPELRPIEERSVPVAATADEGRSVRAWLSARMPGSATWADIGAPTRATTTPASLLVPKVADLELGATVAATAASGDEDEATLLTTVPLTDATATVSVTAGPAPRWITPAKADARGLAPGAVIEWSGAGRCFLTIRPEDGIGARYYISSEENRFTVPALARLDRALTPQSRYMLELQCERENEQGHREATFLKRRVTTR